MKKATLNFGQFKQFDKVFITADNGIDVENVTSVAFDGEILYIAQPDCLVEYTDGKIKKISASVSKLFSRNGRLFAAVGNSLAEIKKGKIKKLAEFYISVAHNAGVGRAAVFVFGYKAVDNALLKAFTKRDGTV